MTWEYLIIDRVGHSSNWFQNLLDRYGQEGWELVAVSDGAAYLKRPLKEESE